MRDNRYFTFFVILFLKVLSVIYNYTNTVKVVVLLINRDKWILNREKRMKQKV
jgi:hypothetical protein